MADPAPLPRNEHTSTFQLGDVSAGKLEQLLDVGIALSATRDLNTLLRRILREARRFTKADAGTLYLLEDETLRAEAGECQTFVERWGEEKAQSLFQTFSLPVDRGSIAGAAALTKEVINIPDVQALGPDSPFQYNPTYDREHDYDTRSNLAVPLLDRDGAVVGVLQLINAERHGNRCAFSDSRVKLARALASQAAVAIQNARLTTRLRDAHLDTLRRLGVAAEWRDKETANHIARVSRFCRTLAETLGWSADDAERLELASAMHDVGKVGIPDAILHKPGKLDPEERTVMETHTIVGANILARGQDDLMRESRRIALGHHEKWDGSGYPQRLAGEAIPLSCRIVAFADVYDALSCRRCYKPPFPEEKVLAILDADTGTHFCPAVAEAFHASIGAFREIRTRYEDTDADFAKFRDYGHIQIEE